MKRLVIIGQAPSSISDPTRPLSGKSGDRIRSLFGKNLPSLKERISYFNILQEFPGKAGKGDNFDVPHDFLKERFIEIVSEFISAKEVPIVLILGHQIASGLGSWDRNYFEKIPFSLNSKISIATGYIIPHPSGINRWWNRGENLKLAKKFFQKLAKEVLEK